MLDYFVSDKYISSLLIEHMGREDIEGGDNMAADFYWWFDGERYWNNIFCSKSDCKKTDCVRHLNGDVYQNFLASSIATTPKIIDFGGYDDKKDAARCTNYTP